MTVGNGEGNYFADEETLDRLEGEGQVVFRYQENPNGSARAIAEQIRARIKAETQLTASAGVSYNKFIAKHNDYTTTDETTVYTVPAAKKAILSELWFSNDDTGNTIAVTVKMYNSEGTAFILSEGTIAAGVSGEAMPRPQIMDESEAIKVTAGTANRLHTHFSILEIGNPG